jgi:hypothetical protein
VKDTSALYEFLIAGFIDDLFELSFIWNILCLI